MGVTRSERRPAEPVLAGSLVGEPSRGQPGVLDVVPPFANHLPVRVAFGDGVVARLPQVLADLGVRRPWVLADAHALRVPALERALSAVVDGLDPVVEVAPAGEPTVERVDELGHPRLR